MRAVDNFYACLLQLFDDRLNSRAQMLHALVILFVRAVADVQSV